MDCFDAEEGDVRERRYYITQGYAADSEALIPTGNIYERDVDYLAEFHIH